eukprot:TRINITY_DN2739_c1_g2_i1.p4 TRINITY_DN2739_c1_g2~~TRINITY_DN2739_c1_g2_i1.p4  ORF type:complete len:145 (+),score=67.93 TRINITY_DN2739_c1_g2_i1:68-502(+)
MVDLSTVGVPRACGVRFDQFLKCLSRNPTDIGSCQAEYSALSECAAEHKDATLFERIFDPDHADREKTIVGKTFGAAAPQVFDADAERTQSPAGAALGKNFPRLFTDDAPRHRTMLGRFFGSVAPAIFKDDDDDDDGGDDKGGK